MMMFRSRILHVSCDVICFLVVLTATIASAEPGWAQVSGDDFIAVANRLHLAEDRIPCERIPLGKTGDYKPCIARLSDGELLMVAFDHRDETPEKPGEMGGRVFEQCQFFRSRDGGKTWSAAEKPDLPGREFYLTVLRDDTIFLTAALLDADVRNTLGYQHCYVYRSTDRGKTWETTQICSEGVKPKTTIKTTRNILELDDGALLMGVDLDGGPHFVWRSADKGITWDRQTCDPVGFKSIYGFFGGETWLWQARSGKVWALVRVDSIEHPIEGKPHELQSGMDQFDHFQLWSSADQGRTFNRVRDIGDYAHMYMSILRLQDQRLLLTFTVRALEPFLGVRGVLCDEKDDGFQFDFEHDRLMLDTRTPTGVYQGGGFGPTVQLDDGTLVTSYSYRSANDPPDPKEQTNKNQTHLEVVRWRAPKANGK